MRTWRKTLGVVAGGLVGLGGWISSADAQYPPPGAIPPGMGLPGGMPMGMGMPGGGMAMPPMGAMPPSMGGPSAVPSNGSGFSPGAFGGAPMGAPADFPNPSQPSGETASPLSIKEEGMPNAFSILHDPRRREDETYFFTLNGGYINYHISPAGTNAVLATTGTTAGLGIIGANGTSVLVPSGNLLNYGDMSGARYQMGIALGWLLPLEISGFTINHTQNIFQGGSSDATGSVISRPVTLQDQGSLPTVLPVNVPGQLNGTLLVKSQMSFWSAEGNFLCNFADTDAFRLDFLFGYRHLDLYESLQIMSSSGGTVGTVGFQNVVAPAGSSVLLTDNFRTRNQFNGGQVGIRGVLKLFDRWDLFVDTKVALGNMNEQLNINGNTTLTTTGGSTTAPGGLLALPSNIGQLSQNRFAVVPDATLTLSYQIHPHIRIFGGYNVLYANTVIRPGDAISNAVDSRQVPVSATFVQGQLGSAPSQPSLVTRSLFANGYNVGIEIGF